MAYLAYVLNTLGVEAQIIHDEGLTKYLINQKHYAVVEQYKLTEDEAELPISMLTKMYPFKTGEGL